MTTTPDVRHGLSRVAAAQGAYYLTTGLWPLLSIQSFEAVTGPKRDKWLVKTVGALVSAVGTVFAVASRRRVCPPEIWLLGVGSAIAFTAVDCIYVAKRRISPIYLLDALAELALILAWTAPSLPSISPRCRIRAEGQRRDPEEFRLRAARDALATPALPGDSKQQDSGDRGSPGAHQDS